MASLTSSRPRRPSLKHSSPLPSTSRSLNIKASVTLPKDKSNLSTDDYSVFTSPNPGHYQTLYKTSHNALIESPVTDFKIDDPHKSRKHQHKSSVKSIGSFKEDPRSKERSVKGKERDFRSMSGRHDFPDFQQDAASPFGNGQATPKSRARNRPTPSSSSRYDWIDSPHMQSFRDSGSSSLTALETPPHTPIDDLLSLRGSLERISVIAPVSGVEVMDAMVDGMNGFGPDDRFFSRTLTNTRPSKTERAGFHPLYQPPLPTPPPGIRLGGAVVRKDSQSSSKDSDEDDEEIAPRPYTRSYEKRKTRRPRSSPHFAPSSAAMRHRQQPSGDIHFPKVNPTIDEIIQKYAPEIKVKKAATSASEIPGLSGAAQSYPSRQSPQYISLDEDDPIMVPLTAEEEAEFMTRSSVDSVAEEVRNTIQTQARSPWPVQHANSFAHRQSVYSDSVSIRSPQSDAGRESSIYSFSATSSEPRQPISGSGSYRTPSASQTIAQYLRSARLTTLLKLTCAPHASRDHPLTVSLSDLGSHTGSPLVVFLGLGCVRHIMGLYDEMAECLGLRLITIDRWGLGRTQVPQSKLARGIPEWSSVVAEVLDQLGIEKCSIMAHSAGAPYALAFANQYRHRVRGDIFLLAPWIGESAGYKWLKYVPNGILKTAQAAEWKIQAWMLGKPPTITYEGIGYNLRPPYPQLGVARASSTPPKTSSIYGSRDTTASPCEDIPRPSIGSSTFSEYDDLRDFDGRFESRSTVGANSAENSNPRHMSETKPASGARKKPSKSFLGRLKGTSNSQPASPATDKPSPSGPGKRLKALKSMSSLRSKASSAPSTISRAPSVLSTSKPELPQTLAVEVGLGLDEINWGTSQTLSSVKRSPAIDEPPPSSYVRFNGSRSVSVGAYKSSQSSFPPSPPPVSVSSSPVDVLGGSYQAMLGNALIAASHAESAKGTHSDLVQILNHDRVPWGFSYTDYPHEIRVWYGDKDEKIAESAVRWLEHTMGADRCHVHVVKGADHALMYKSAVVIDVFEQTHDYARDD